MLLVFCVRVVGCCQTDKMREVLSCAAMILGLVLLRQAGDREVPPGLELGDF